MTNWIETIERLSVERLRIDNALTHAAVRYVADYLAENNLDHILVDDENDMPSFALDEYDDMSENDDLNQAVGWLPRRAITNIGPARYRPAVTAAALADILSDSAPSGGPETAPENSTEPSSSTGTPLHHCQRAGRFIV